MGVKIALYVFIIAGCGLYGIFKAQKYVERVKLLEDFVTAAEIIKIELVYRREPLPDLLHRLLKTAKSLESFSVQYMKAIAKACIHPKTSAIFLWTSAGNSA